MYIEEQKKTSKVNSVKGGVSQRSGQARKHDHRKDLRPKTPITPIRTIHRGLEGTVALLLEGSPLAGVVPFNCFAKPWNAAKLSGPSSTALAANTIPWPQWFPCRQYAQIGLVYRKILGVSLVQNDNKKHQVLTLFTWIVKVGKVVDVSATGMLEHLRQPLRKYGLVVPILTILSQTQPLLLCSYWTVVHRVYRMS